MRGSRRVGVVALALMALPRLVPARDAEPLVAPVRCVSDYLEAVTAAAPPRPSRAASGGTGSAAPDLRWARTRSYLAPRTDAELDAGDRPQPLAAWRTLGRDGAFLGYEILAARRAPRGGVVVIARERTARAPGANAVTAACAYLLGKVRGAWRIADKRCGRDFANSEIASGYQGYWDEAPAADAGHADDSFGEDLE